jgi:putative tricarboxylic transport membrane protein
VTALIRSPRDFWTGLLYIVFGASAILVARHYEMGNAFKMGPGYFPTVLGGLLMLIGLLAVGRAFWKQGTPIGAFTSKGLLLVLASTLVFGLVVRGAGLVIALPLLVLISASASVRFRWGPSLALALGLTVFCTLVFLKGLGVPLPLLGAWFGS